MLPSIQGAIEPFYEFTIMQWNLHLLQRSAMKPKCLLYSLDHIKSQKTHKCT